MAVDLERQMAQLEVKLLRAQFNSHFLFNNLNAINFHILKNDSQTASFYLTLFSRLMRRIIADTQRDFNKLSEEIETIRLYIQIESMRFNRKIRFDTAIDPDIDPGQIWIPSLILHTYLENTIWQGLQPNTVESELKLAVHKKLNIYNIELRGNGFASQKNRPHSMYTAEESGITMARERLQLLNQCYGTDMQITADTDKAHPDASGTSVVLSFAPFLL